MDDLVQFLRDRLAEDEQTALAASTGPWRSYTGPERKWLSKGDLIHPVDTWDHKASDPVIMTALWTDSQHIAWWNPERVLREVEAKRRILDGPTTVVLLKLLALPYNEHADYRDAWRP